MMVQGPAALPWRACWRYGAGDAGLQDLPRNGGSIREFELAQQAVISDPDTTFNARDPNLE